MDAETPVENEKQEEKTFEEQTKELEEKNEGHDEEETEKQSPPAPTMSSLPSPPPKQEEGGFNPSKTVQNVLDSTKNISLAGSLGSLKKSLASFDPLAKEIGKGFRQAVQYAGEKIGTAEITPLPQEYVDLEARVDRLKMVYENLIRVAAHQIQPGAGTEFKFTMYNTLNNVVDQLGTENSGVVQDKLRNISVQTQSPNHILASTFNASASSMADDTPFGTALKKSAEAQSKIGQSRVQMNLEINSKFIQKLSISLETNFRNVYTARRNVLSSRVRLDAIKSQAKSATPAEVEVISDDLQMAQAEFNSHVSIASDLMKALLSAPEGVVALKQFTQAMQNYFQEGLNILHELAPELDAIHTALDPSALGSVESV